ADLRDRDFRLAPAQSPDGSLREARAADTSAKMSFLRWATESNSTLQNRDLAELACCFFQAPVGRVGKAIQFLVCAEIQALRRAAPQPVVPSPRRSTRLLTGFLRVGCATVVGPNEGGFRPGRGRTAAARGFFLRVASRGVQPRLSRSIQSKRSHPSRRKAGSESAVKESHALEP